MEEAELFVNKAAIEKDIELKKVCCDIWLFRNLRPPLMNHVFAAKGKRKALVSERTVREQEQVVADMKLHMVQASAEQMKKVMREYSVEKQSVENEMIVKDIEIKKVRSRVGVRAWAGLS